MLVWGFCSCKIINISKLFTDGVNESRKQWSKLQDILKSCWKFVTLCCDECRVTNFIILPYLQWRTNKISRTLVYYTSERYTTYYNTAEATLALSHSWHGAIHSNASSNCYQKVSNRIALQIFNVMEPQATGELNWTRVKRAWLERLLQQPHQLYKIRVKIK